MRSSWTLEGVPAVARLVTLEKANPKALSLLDDPQRRALADELSAHLITFADVPATPELKRLVVDWLASFVVHRSDRHEAMLVDVIILE